MQLGNKDLGEYLSGIEFRNRYQKINKEELSNAQVNTLLEHLEKASVDFNSLKEIVTTLASLKAGDHEPGEFLNVAKIIQLVTDVSQQSKDPEYQAQCNLLVAGLYTKMASSYLHDNVPLMAETLLNRASQHIADAEKLAPQLPEIPGEKDQVTRLKAVTRSSEQSSQAADAKTFHPKPEPRH